MPRKSSLVVVALAAILLAASLCRPPAAVAGTPSRVDRQGPGGRYVVVSRDARHLVFVLSRSSKYKLSQRAHGYLIFQRVPKKRSPIVSAVVPNGGVLTFGSSETVGWEMSSAVGTGYFRASLKTVGPGSKTAVVADAVAAASSQRSYSVGWNVNQPVGEYRLWVYYCAPNGKVISSRASDSNLTIAPAPTPTPSVDPSPTPTPTPSATPEPTPTATPTPTPTPTPTTSPSPTPSPTPTSEPPGSVVVAGFTGAAIQSAIDSLGSAGGTVFLPAGVYAVGSPITLPAGNSATMTICGNDATLDLTASKPRAFIWKKTAPEQTFRHFVIRDLTVNAPNHPASGNYCIVLGDTVDGWATDINVEDVTVANVVLHGTPASNSGAWYAKGVNVYVQDNGGAANHLSDITVTGCRLEGVSHGVTVWATNGVSPTTISNVVIRDNWVDTLVHVTGFETYSNYHIGQHGLVNGLIFTGNYGANSGDNGVEVNNATGTVLLEGNTFVDPFTCAFWATNFVQTDTQAQAIVWRNNKVIVDREVGGGAGSYGFAVASEGYPLGRLSYLDNSYDLRGAVQQTDHRAFQINPISTPGVVIDGLSVTQITSFAPSFFVYVAPGVPKTVRNVVVNGASS